MFLPPFIFLPGTPRFLLASIANITHGTSHNHSAGSEGDEEQSPTAALGWDTSLLGLIINSCFEDKEKWLDNVSIKLQICQIIMNQIFNHDCEHFIACVPLCICVQV
jgi:hypothetical protein